MLHSRRATPVLARFDPVVVLLVLSTLAPFVPAARQFIERGVPDHLFTGDGATLEMRVLHAGDAAQYLGPYSRYQWNHPGPLFFYLALPVYEAFGERGPALNLFVLLVNLGIAISIVFIARQLRGTAFAWSVAALLAVFELIALPFVRTGEWNPVSPILPLVLLSFLTARLALGHLRLLPVFALTASAIVQTHLGYAPEVAALAAVALLWNLPRVVRTWPPPVAWYRGPLIGTGIVMILCWALPLYESATTVPGNLRQIVDFFSASNGAPPPWDVVFGTVFSQLAAVPAAVVRAFYWRVPMPGPMASEAIALAQMALVLAAAKSAWQRRDATLGVLTAIAVSEIAAAILAVRGIRGEALDYLVLWVRVPGVMSLAVAAAWVTSERPWWPTAAAAAGIVLVALALVSPGRSEPAFRERNEAAEQFARDVEAAILSGKFNTPVVRIASSDIWPTAAGVILHLRKRHVPFYVEPSWGFMFGKPLVDPGGDRPRLLIGNRSLDQQALADRQLSRVAAGGDIVAYVDSSGSLAEHRVEEAPTLTASSEIERDPKLAVDGVIPVDGTTWNSPQSAILRSTSASITIAVPHGGSRIGGLFASIDGNDLYRLQCVGREGTWHLGVERPEQGLVGMQVRKVVADEIAACDAVTIAPVSGDGFYSIGEIGFLR
jgi:hypothetical protein